MGRFSYLNLIGLLQIRPNRNFLRSKDGSSRPALFAEKSIGDKRWQAIRNAIVIMLLSSTDALGQSITSEGAANQELLLEQARAREAREKQERTVDVHLGRFDSRDAAMLQFNESPCFVIDEIVFVGDGAAAFNWALSAAGRAGAVNDSAIGRCVGTEDIHLLMRRVQNEILRRGYITTRVLLAPQDLNSRTLSLTLIPGRLRSVRNPQGSKEIRTDLGFWNAVPIAIGDVLNLRDVEQALENFKRLPTVDADIQITPAEEPDARVGDSDLLINWKQENPVRVNVSVDNAGSRATGKHQGSVTFAYDNLLHLNDLFYATLSHDIDRAHSQHGTRGTTAHYSVPFEYWLLGITASRNPYYQSVEGATQTYVYSGKSQNATVSLTGWARTSRNFIEDTEVEVQRRRMAGWEVGVTHRQVTDGGAAIEVHISYRHGTGAANALRAPEEAFGEGTSRFAILATDGSITAPIVLGPLAFRYTGTWRAQSNRTSLIVQDRFAIGGRYTVRGFDGESSLVAERGWLLRNELAVPLGRSKQELYGGLDFGKVNGPSSAALVGRSLTGGVVGLRGAIARTQYDIFLGAPIRKPQLFRTARVTWGFSINANF
jgi:hemolysin activation/secretion protein